MLRQKLNAENLVLLLGFCAFFYIISAILGTVNHYNPVPFWDMWSGYLVFFTDAANDPTIWWSQHNEHRLILNRLFFFIDIKIFHGTLIFLLVVNYLLIFASYVIFFLCSRETNRHCEHGSATHIINCLILILLFSRLQTENFDQPFQAQFFLAQLFPLLSFYLFHRSVKTSTPSCDGVTSEDSEIVDASCDGVTSQDSEIVDMSHDALKSKNSKIVTPSHDGVHLGYFTLSCFIGVISVGTMINGILTLPLIAVLAAVFKMPKKLIAVPTILAAVTIFFYFRNYAANSTIADAVLHPVDLAQYILSYLGNPFYHLLQSKFIAQIAGLLLVLSSLFLLFKNIKNPHEYSLQFALLAFIFYVEISAVMAGFGRLSFGIDQAFSSRYATPLLMSWSALLIIGAPLIVKKFKNFTLLFILVPIVFLPSQIKSLKPNQNEIFERKISALAAELQINDQKQLYKICVPEFILTKIKPAIEQHLSIFNNPEIKDVNQLIGNVDPDNFTTKCTGNLEKITTIEDQKYLQIQGRIFEPTSNSTPKIIHLNDSKNRIIGYALSDKNQGFKGYILKEFSNQKIILKGFEPNCELQLIRNE